MVEQRGVLPASMVVCRLGDRTCGLALSAVERVLPTMALTALPEAPPVVLGVFNLHGAIVPVVDVRSRLGFPSRPWGLAGHVVVARSARRRLAFAVDEVDGVVTVPRDAVVRPGDVLPGVRRIAGILPLPEGLLFLHDLDTLLDLPEEEQLTRALAAPGP